MIAVFSELTSATKEEASFLESHKIDLDSAVSTFFEKAVGLRLHTRIALTFVVSRSARDFSPWDLRITRWKIGSRLLYTLCIDTFIDPPPDSLDRWLLSDESSSITIVSYGLPVKPPPAEECRTPQLHRRPSTFQLLQVRTISLFGEVWGIGPATPLKLYEKGHRSLEDLKSDDTLIQSNILGLKYFDDIKTRIPRDEVQEMECLLQKDREDVLPGNLVNTWALRIPFPWLIFNEKIKVNSVFLLDTTVVSDSVLLLFCGSISKGDIDGHLKMLGGYLEFFMEPSLAKLYHNLRKDLDELFQYKLIFDTSFMVVGFHVQLMKDHHHCKLKKSKHGILISIAVKPQASRANSVAETFSEFKHLLLVYKFNSKFSTFLCISSIRRQPYF
ncbi:unnamed protein product [Lactuca saligna]|uniref:Uncharacterized protein n=1 Tax=Lactuca saligna TaxID=75948 RepID=A0AA35ZUP0_LACSI|nr:unnamed protein product [Lactuca saligna]